VKNKIKEWLRRYLLADILSTALSLATAWVIHRTTGDNVLAAFVGSAMASISFYGIIAYNDVRKSLKHHRKHDLSYGFVAYFKDLRNLIIEFGPSEILDVLAVRPFFMYLMFWVKHPGQSVPVFEDIAAAFGSGSLPLQIAIVLGMAGVAVFGVLNLRYLAWNLGKFKL